MTALKKVFSYVHATDLEVLEVQFSNLLKLL